MSRLVAWPSLYLPRSPFSSYTTSSHYFDTNSPTGRRPAIHHHVYSRFHAKSMLFYPSPFDSIPGEVMLRGLAECRFSFCFSFSFFLSSQHNLWISNNPWRTSYLHVDTKTEKIDIMRATGTLLGLSCLRRSIRSHTCNTERLMLFFPALGIKHRLNSTIKSRPSF